MKGYRSLLKACREKHGHTRFARFLWGDCQAENKSDYSFSPEEIPCGVACMLRYDLPVAIGDYLTFEKKWSALCL